MGNLVAIVGRPNVGKSTFFNRLIGYRMVIEDSVSGVTRDRIYGKAEWNGKVFSVIDTGGYVKDSNNIFEKEIRNQVEIAINEADVIIFMVDVIDGVTPLDIDIAQLLRRSKKKVFLTANKSDNLQRFLQSNELFSLGFEKVYPISSINGLGTGELLDDISKYLSDKKDESEDENLPKICIVGRPNVGKSSLCNVLLGEERCIVTPIAGTTRDSIHTKYNKFGFEFLLIDTAGLRKKSKITENIEFYTYLRAIKSIENADVCILMLDAQQGLEKQDLNILRIIVENNKGVVIAVNKWDLIDKKNILTAQYSKIISERLTLIKDVPIIFISTIKKQRIYKVLEKALEVYRNRQKKIPTSKLNEVLLPIIEQYPPPITKGKKIKIKYITQLKTVYPAFVFFCNLPQYIKEPYKRFLEGKIRENFDFGGVPLTLFFREK